MTPRSLPLPIGAMIGGKYRIDGVLGTGGMGTVFAAENVDIGRQVAIKVLHNDLARDDDLVHRLRQEARAAAAIGHPGIVDVLDLGSTDAGDPFIVMERLDGEPLGARLAHRNRLPPAIAVGILLKVVEALSAAHAKGIVHRDLKPDNIFLIIQPTAAVKLVDFGIAKHSSDDLSITHSGVVMGTPLYMSPEQARGARDVGPASDLYSIGAILYQTLSGVPPHVAGNYNEMLAKILMHEITPLSIAVPGLPSALTELVHALLDRDPTHRPTAIDTANRLRVIARLLDDSTIAFSPTLQPDNVSDVPMIALDATAAPTHTSASLGITTATMPPTMLGDTAPSVATRPSLSSGAISAQMASTPETSSRRRALPILLALATLAVILAIVIIATRGPSSSVAHDGTPAATLPDARLSIDAATVVDAAIDAAPVAPADANVPPPRRDAAVPRDAAAPRPDAATVRPDAGDGLDIDDHNPVKPR